jgi:hypothetical protein
MQIHNLLSRLDAIENSPRKSIFESIGQGDQYFSTWEREIHPTLCEVALAPDQIQKLFTTIEKGAGRSTLGKAGDMVKGAKDKISDVWFNKFGGMLQSSGPVQAFDQKFEEIKSKIAAKNPELAAKLAKYGEFAKNNPKLHKFLLAIAGSAAAALGVAVAGGIGAGALAVGTGTGIAVGVINIADRLLQGQKASTAIGRGATAGAVAGLTAAGVSAASKALEQLGAVQKIGRTYRVEFNGVSAYVKPEDARAWEDGMAAARGLTKNIDFMSNPDAYFKASSAGMDASAEVAAAILSKASDPAYQEAAAKLANTVIQPGAIAQAAAAIGELASKLNPIFSAAAGQAAGNAGEKSAPSPAPAPVAESLNRAQLNELFGITGNKVDASTLQKAWTNAGSPTDSEEVAKILQAAGVDPAVISQAYTDMSLPAPAGATTTTTTPVNTKDLLAQIMKLTPTEQQQVLAHLKK